MVVKDKRKIPKGPYCHGKLIRENGILREPFACPYWKHKKFYLKDVIWVIKTNLKKMSLKELEDIYNSKNVFLLFFKIYKCEKKYGKYICTYCNLKDTYQGNTLLWDECKECGIDDEIE